MTNAAIYNYTTKYIPEDFWQILDLNQTLRLRLLKDVTGCGATYGIMKHDYPDKRIMVMPTKKLIDDKQRQADNGEFGLVTTISLHGESKYTVKQITNADIILMTPDQLVSIYENNEDIFNDITGNLIVIDEEHTFEGAGVYRPAFGKIEHIIKTHWTGSIITITATEPFCVSPYFDKFDIIQLTNKYRLKHEVEVTKSTGIFDRKLEQVILTGERVVIVTNNISYFRSVKKRYEHLGIHTKTGNTLKQKLLYEQFIDNNEGQIIIITTSATEGIDLDIDAHVMILSDYGQDAFVFSLQTIIQALGRPRGKLLDAMVCLSIPNWHDDNKYVPDVIEDIKYVDKQIKAIKAQKLWHPGKIEDALIKLADTIEIKGEHVTNTQALCAAASARLNYNITHASDYIKKMNNYAAYTNITFIPVKKIAIRLVDKNIRPSFKELLTSAMTLNATVLQKTFDQLKIEIRGGKRYGSISKNYMIVNLLAQLHKKTKDPALLQQLAGDNITASRALTILNSACIKQNNIDFDYWWAGLSNIQQLKWQANNTKLLCKRRVIALNNTPQLHSNLAPKASIKGMSKNAIGHIDAEYTFDDIYFNQQEVDIIQLMYYISPTNSRTKTILQEEHDVSVVKKAWDEDTANKHKKAYNSQINELMGLCVNELTLDRQIVMSTRIYGAVTSLSKRIINRVHPHDVLEIDISSANPAFVDQMIGSNLQDKVYDNISKVHNISRSQAKIKYNILLNTSAVKWRQPHSKEYYLDLWGYNKEEAEHIVLLTAEQGNMFYDMTGREQDVIATIMNVLNIQPNERLATIRRHDSIMVFGQKANMLRIIKLIKTYDFVEFKIHYTKSW